MGLGSQEPNHRLRYRNLSQQQYRWSRWYFLKSSSETFEGLQRHARTKRWLYRLFEGASLLDHAVHLADNVVQMTWELNACFCNSALAFAKEALAFSIKASLTIGQAHTFHWSPIGNQLFFNDSYQNLLHWLDISCGHQSATKGIFSRIRTQILVPWYMICGQLKFTAWTEVLVQNCFLGRSFVHPLLWQFGHTFFDGPS